MLKLLMLEDKTQDTLTSLGLLIMRVWIGAVMLIAHGWPKLASYSERADSFADPLGMGPTMSLISIIFAEVICSILLAIGLTTRLAAVPLLIGLLVAAFIVHGDDPWQRQEFALLYAMTYLMFLFTGPGKFSLDHVIVQKFKRS